MEAENRTQDLSNNRTPKKYYQTLRANEGGTFGLFETWQFNDNGWFETEEEAETFIKENFWDHDPPKESGHYETLVIVPVFTVRFKKVRP